MEIYSAKDLSFTYPTTDRKAINNLNLTINKGEVITVCGKSGCGKTTLLRLLKPLISPHGEIVGDIYFDGMPITTLTQREQCEQIGFVLQNPDDQIVCDKVWHELAFGLESMGINTNEIRARVSETACYFGIQNIFHKKVCELSGGQKQLINLASVMVMCPTVIILDEPTSQLDPIAAHQFLKTLERLNKELGITVILAEQRLEEAFAISDRVIVMDAGNIIADDIPSQIGRILYKKKYDMRYALPTPTRIYNAVTCAGNAPVTVRDGRLWLEKYAAENKIYSEKIPSKSLQKSRRPFSIELKDVWFRYKKDFPDVIKGLNLQVYSGEHFAIVGGNGVGKSTALSLISGLNKQYHGEILINGEKITKISNLYDGILGILPQSPKALFLKKSVYLDLLETLQKENIPQSEIDVRIERMSTLCGITHLLNRHPYDLSGGEQQRAALAKILIKTPKIILLDEPTKGMDASFKKVFASIIKNLTSEGITVVTVSHDIEFCAEYADRCAMFFDGNITSLGEPREFFTHNSFYTTNANRMARTVFPDTLLAEDVIAACGGKTENSENKTIDYHIGLINQENNSPKNNIATFASEQKNKIKFTKPIIAAVLMFLIAVPLTILVGIKYFGDRKYYLISMIIILETMIPFFAKFENRKPKARELVVISVLSAAAIAGRVAFFMLPQFKPVIAIIIISGVCFGGEVGFLVGATVGFVSNFYFMQGPWTPWQMFSLGIIGFFAGLLFQRGLLRKNKVSLCVFGAISAFFIYGGIMKPASVIIAEPNFTLSMIVSAYISGIPYDLIHSVSTVFFLWFISWPLINKLERVKIKYGLTD